jgi:hypothetical protein
VIDIATGYTSGWIDFGDGTGQVPYVSGEFIDHDYDTIGDFIVTLVLTNELGCMDTFSRPICVEIKWSSLSPMFFPLMEMAPMMYWASMLMVFGEVHWTIFSKWGEKVFEAHSLDAVWDGTFHGHALDPGVFVVQVDYTNQETGAAGEKISTVTLVR